METDTSPNLPQRAYFDKLAPTRPHRTTGKRGRLEDRRRERREEAMNTTYGLHRAVLLNRNGVAMMFENRRRT